MRTGWSAGRLLAALAAARSEAASEALKVDTAACCADEKRERKAAMRATITPGDVRREQWFAMGGSRAVIPKASRWTRSMID